MIIDRTELTWLRMWSVGEGFCECGNESSAPIKYITYCPFAGCFEYGNDLSVPIKCI